MEHVFSHDGTRIAFDRYGSGPALILVGGAFQHRRFDPQTAHLAALLAPAFTTYHYDRRGRGDSGDTLPYAVAREIEDIAAVLAAAGGTARLFGMSSGGVLALDAAHTLGSRILQLAVYEAPVTVEGADPPVAADYTARLHSLLAADRRGEAVALFMTEAVGVPAEYVAPMRQDPSWATMESVAPTLAYDNAIMTGLVSGQPWPVDRWSAVTQPTLVLDGGASPDSSHAGADALAALLPHARRRTLADQSHQVDPAVLAPVLLEFYGSA